MQTREELINRMSINGRKGGSTRTAKTKNKGFASMTPEKLRLVSIKGGQTKARLERERKGESQKSQ